MTNAGKSSYQKNKFIVRGYHMTVDNNYKTLSGINFVRALAILAVVIIHVTADLTVRIGESSLALAEGSKTQIFFFAINKLCNFAVPIFIILSGLVLFYRYKNDWGTHKVLSFYKKRLFSALIPYIFWAIIYYFYNQFLFFDDISFDWDSFINDFLWGNTSYHLYFMIIILQFYILFPLLVLICIRFAWFAKYMILIGVIIQGTFYVMGSWFFSFDHKAALCWNYFLYFMVGGYIGLKYDEIKSLRNRTRLQITSITALSGIALLSLFLGNRYLNVSISNHWFEIALIVYSICVFLFLLNIEPVVSKYVSSISRTIHSVGTHSFGIYLIHPALLSLFVISIKPSGMMSSYHFYVFLSLIWTLLGSYLLILIYKTFSKSIVNYLAQFISNRSDRRNIENKKYKI